MGQPPLARGRVRYVGEAIAVVVAESQRLAVDAADGIVPEIDPLPVVSDVAVALEGEALVFPEFGSNLIHDDAIGSAGPRPAADVSVRIEVDIPRVSSVPIEPNTILVDGSTEPLEVWCGHQSPGLLATELARALGLEPADIRVRVPDVGGGFGPKGQFYPEYAVVAEVARRLGRRVAWLQSRREQLICGFHGRSQRVTVELGGSRDGRFSYLSAEYLGDVGAYPKTGARIPIFTRAMAPGMYDIPHVISRSKVVVTNRAPTGPYRGAGRPEAAMAIERAVDAFADAIGMTPEDVRRRNYVTEFPFTSQTGAVYDSGDYATALAKAVEMADIDGWRKLQRERRETGGRPLGIGIGSFLERAGGSSMQGEYGRVELRPDGRIELRSGSTPAGQGHRTVWSQIVADVLTVPPEKVDYIAGDTGLVARSFGTFGSRSAQLGGSALYRTATAVRDKAREVAADMLEASADDLELVDGRFRVRGAPGAEVDLESVARHAAASGVELMAEEVFEPGGLSYPYGVYVAVVEVEVETGEVVLVDLVAVDDCGNVLNPMIVEGQLHGSVMQGLGTVFLEEAGYDADGQPVGSTLMSYLIPTATQAFPLRSGRLFTPSPTNPLGVKGSGEAGCIGVPPAVLNATLDALEPFGVTALDLPLTPLRVWEAIQQAKS